MHNLRYLILYLYIIKTILYFSQYNARIIDDAARVHQSYGAMRQSNLLEARSELAFVHGFRHNGNHSGY